MKATRAHLWTSLAVAVAVVFIAWSAVLLVSALGAQRAVSANVTTLNLLDVYGGVIRTLEQAALDSAPPADEARRQMRWTELRNGLDDIMTRLAETRRHPDVAARFATLRDTVTARLETLRTRLETDADVERRRAIAEDIRREVRAATADHLQLVRLVRKDQARMSTRLRRGWFQLTTIIIVACLLAATLAIITHRLQSALGRLGQMDRVLTRERDALGSMLEITDALVIVLDHRGGIVRFNRACERVTGYSADEVMGRRFWDFLIPESERETIVTGFADLRTAGAFSERENHWVTRDGESRRIAWTNTCLRDDDGAVFRIVATGIDVTERRELAMGRDHALRDLTVARNRLSHLLQATARITTAATESEALGRIAAAVNGAGWNQVTACLVSGGAIRDQQTAGHRGELIDAAGEALVLRIVAEDGSLDSHRIGRSVMVPGGPDANGDEDDDAWRAGDVACVPLINGRAETIGAIRLVDPVDERRPDATGFSYLEFFADLAARTIEHLRVERERLTALERFRGLAEIAPVGIDVSDVEGLTVYCNERWRELIGVPKNESARGRFPDRVHPNDRERVLGQWHAALGRQERYETEFQLRQDTDRYIWVSIRTAPRYDVDNRFAGIISTLTDVTDLKVAEEELRERSDYERLLRSELDHRVRNNLSALLTLVDHAVGTADDTSDLAATMRARIQTISAVHTLLSRWQTARLDRLIEAVVQSHRPGALRLEGEDVYVPAGQASALAMILNELGANSAKYGALGSPDGTVTIGWNIAEETDTNRTVTLHWTESAGPEIASPTSPGTGTALIEGIVRSDLRGEVRLNYPPAGARHEFRITLDRRERELPTA